MPTSFSVQRAGEQTMRLGAPREGLDPADALLEEVARSAGHVDFLRRKCEELAEEELVWNRSMESRERQDGLGGMDSSYVKGYQEHRSQVNGWWALYEKERTHLVTVSQAALRAGIDERRVKLAERAVDALEEAIDGVVRDLGMNPEDAHVRGIVATRLRALTGVDESYAGAHPEQAQRRAGGPDEPVVVDGTPATGQPDDGRVEF